MATKQQRAMRLEDRIEELRAEIDDIIDERVAKIASRSPGVPAGVIRNLLTARAPACRCAQYMQLCGSEAKNPD
jgi:hypothetical protein